VACCSDAEAAGRRPMPSARCGDHRLVCDAVGALGGGQTDVAHSAVPRCWPGAPGCIPGAHRLSRGRLAGGHVPSHVLHRYPALLIRCRHWRRPPCRMSRHKSGEIPASGCGLQAISSPPESSFVSRQGRCGAARSIGHHFNPNDHGASFELASDWPWQPAMWSSSGTVRNGDCPEWCMNRQEFCNDGVV
jgi:hypothetical protein